MIHVGLTAMSRDVYGPKAFASILIYKRKAWVSVYRKPDDYALLVCGHSPAHAVKMAGEALNVLVFAEMRKRNWRRAKNAKRRTARQTKRVRG